MIYGFMTASIKKEREIKYFVFHEQASTMGIPGQGKTPLMSESYFWLGVASLSDIAFARGELS